MGGSQSTTRRQRPEPTAPAPPPVTVSAQDHAVLELKVQRDKLRMYQRRLSTVMARETEAARAMIREGRKEHARLALQKRAYQAGLLEKSSAQLLALEEMVMGVEFAAVEAQVVAGLRAGSDVLSALQKEASLEEVDKILAETAESVAFHDELARRMGMELTPDQATSAEDELEALLVSVVAEKTDTIPEALKSVDARALPAVPRHAPQTTAVEDIAESIFEERLAEPAL